jgi:stage II sporulation protein D
LYEWRAEYSIADLSAIIGAPFSLSHLIKCIKVAKKDDAGLVRQVSIKGARHTKNVTGKNMYSLLKKVKSYCFSIEKKDNIVILKGRGFGHHVGLCQWGAREMVRVGKGYKDILMFYYPGTEFACLH